MVTTGYSPSGGKSAGKRDNQSLGKGQHKQGKMASNPPAEGGWDDRSDGGSAGAYGPAAAAPMEEREATSMARWMADGFRSGHESGFDAGKKAGYDAGLEDGYLLGYTDGQKEKDPDEGARGSGANSDAGSSKSKSSRKKKKTGNAGWWEQNRLDAAAYVVELTAARREAKGDGKGDVLDGYDAVTADSVFEVLGDGGVWGLYSKENQLILQAHWEQCVDKYTSQEPRFNYGLLGVSGLQASVGTL